MTGAVTYKVAALAILNAKENEKKRADVWSVHFLFVTLSAETYINYK
jgi:hypothetical protein